MNMIYVKHCETSYVTSPECVTSNGDRPEFPQGWVGKLPNLHRTFHSDGPFWRVTLLRKPAKRRHWGIRCQYTL